MRKRASGDKWASSAPHFFAPDLLSSSAPEPVLIWNTLGVAGGECAAARPCAASSASRLRASAVADWSANPAPAVPPRFLALNVLMVHVKLCLKGSTCCSWGWSVTMGPKAEAVCARQARGSMWRRWRPAARMRRRGSTWPLARPRLAAARRCRAARDTLRPRRPAARTRTGIPRGPTSYKGASRRLAPARPRPPRRPHRRTAGRLRLAHLARRGRTGLPRTRRRLPRRLSTQARTSRALPRARRAGALARQAQPQVLRPWRRVRRVRPLGRPCWQTRRRTMQLRAHQA